MSKALLKELPELVENNVLTHEEANRIQEYYQQKEQQAPNRLIIVFSILGALLTGMGIILIIAHNWDDLSKSIKLFFALLPLLVGQVLCAFTLYKKSESKAWRETAATLLLFAIAASISIVSQVYHIHGSLAGFLFIWMVLSIPVIYVMRSGMTSLICISVVTWYACEVSYFNYPTAVAWYYWPLIISIIPFYVQLSKASTNFFHFHSWLFVFSLIITLGMFGKHEEEFMFVAYISLFSFLIIVSEFSFIKNNKLLTNAYLLCGSLGMIFTLLLLSFDAVWTELRHGITLEDGYTATVIITLITLGALITLIKINGFKDINAKAYVFLIFIPIFITGYYNPLVGQIAINLLILIIAIATIKDGADKDKLLILNYGLLIITLLILCRFFDTDISFIVRGLLFITVGIGFFGTNYWMIKRRKKDASL